MRPLSDSQREALEEATSAYQGQLTADVARYLLARGIGQEEAVTARLGVVLDPLPGHGRFVGWLSIPYLNKDGRPVQIRFRCLQEHDHRALGHGKYLTVAGESARMYGVDSIHQAGDEIHVTEGELDRVILRHKLGVHAVAAPGAKNWKGRHRRMLAGFSRIWVWGDPDDAGAEFTQRVTRALRQAKGINLKQGDVTDTYLAGGVEALRTAWRGNSQ
ncbi:toprim domain-containing protein [Micromonospora sp. WMMD961]|uniref:toprim domain-containing protein n=1 Tax=Micromonospora sp. WMMD961 TaxID=3016100 RepID=UPI002415B240|nr:toprim domain-containing protein [Micromonospora sp. WMMD961]MDG4783224.1 toprim domain-containing protein [Micromonospora sp. WMMD961]